MAEEQGGLAPGAETWDDARETTRRTVARLTGGSLPARVRCGPLALHRLRQFAVTEEFAVMISGLALVHGNVPVVVDDSLPEDGWEFDD